MTVLTRDQILSAEDTQTETVEVPEWGGSVLVRGLTGAQRDRFEMTTIKQNSGNVEMNFQNARARLLAWSIIDEQGHRIFNDEDIAKLGRKSALAIQRVYRVATRLSGLNDEAIKELTAELKNDQSDGSGSDSL